MRERCQRCGYVPAWEAREDKSERRFPPWPAFALGWTTAMLGEALCFGNWAGIAVFSVLGGVALAYAVERRP